MLPCKEIVRILSSDEKVGFLRRLELKMHLAMCSHCSVYNKHLKLMRNGFKGLFVKITATDSGTVRNLESKIIGDNKKRSGEG